MNEWILALTIFAVLFCWMFTVIEKEKSFQQEREQWKEERQQLLDRIQAPTFAEYTNKVVREKKAEKSDEEKQAVEFIS